MKKVITEIKPSSYWLNWYLQPLFIFGILSLADKFWNHFIFIVIYSVIEEKKTKKLQLRIEMKKNQEEKRIKENQRKMEKRKEAYEQMKVAKKDRLAAIMEIASEWYCVLWYLIFWLLLLVYVCDSKSNLRFFQFDCVYLLSCANGIVKTNKCSNTSYNHNYLWF